MFDQDILRVEAARMAAQVLAGSGADPQRSLALFYAFFAALSVPITLGTEGAAQDNQSARPHPHLTPIDGGKKD